MCLSCTIFVLHKDTEKKYSFPFDGPLCTINRMRMLYKVLTSPTKILVIELKFEPVVKCEDTKPHFGATLLKISYTFLVPYPAYENLFFFHLYSLLPLALTSSIKSQNSFLVS